MVAIGVVFAVIALRLVEVQAANRSHYVQLGVEQRVRTVTLTPDRGNIFDRKGADLALSVQLQSVWADPQVIEHPVEYAAALAPLVGEPELDLRARLSEKDKAFVYVARKVDPAVAEKVKALSLAGVGFTPETKRLYPRVTWPRRCSASSGSTTTACPGSRPGRRRRWPGVREPSSSSATRRGSTSRARNAPCARPRAAPTSC